MLSYQDSNTVGNAGEEKQKVTEKYFGADHQQ